MSYFWFQKTGGEDAWVEALSDQRSKVISEVRPAFVTVLDATSCPDDDWGRDEFNKLRYTGPLYFDWDADKCEDAIKPFHEFLANLQANNVNLNSLRLYATGGRGFHCEIPEEMVNPKPSKLGVALLPYVYKEIALELATECMDLRVYTARKGRMWRTPGIVRKNGKYKVSLTLDQAMSMTPELYDTLTSKPCAEMYHEPPVLSHYLSTMFVKARDKTDKQVKARAKTKSDAHLLTQFNGQFPPTVKSLMDGVGIVPGVGFHKIAMQLAITATALGRSSEDLVAGCEGLVHSHESDSPRYNTPRKRKEELRRMWEYTQGNDLYEYSAGGIKSLCAADVKTPDLDSKSQAGVGMVQEDEEVPDEIRDEADQGRKALLDGLIVLKDGVFRRTAEGAKLISNISFSKPNLLLDSSDCMVVGMEVDVAADSRSKGRQMVTQDVFKSRTNLNAWCFGRGAIFNGTDTQASALQLILSRKAEKDESMTYVTRKEGLDIIQDPTQKGEPRTHMVWASPSGVLGETNGVKYRYAPKLSTSPVFNTDLHTASPLEDTPQTREWVAALLTMNSPVVVGQMLGWFVSCFHKQFYHRAYNQFPLLHPNGTAGSGKTQTTSLMAQMHYNISPPVIRGASANATTTFTLKTVLESSASIPVVIDEYKPSELGHVRHDLLMQYFRMLYNQAAGSTGGVSRGNAEASFRDVTQYTLSAPTAYIGESQEMQTAIVQRTVSVGFSQAESRMHTPSWDVAYAESSRGLMAKLGHTLMLKSLDETVQSRVAALDPIKVGLRATMDKSTHDRQVYNLAVVIAGVDFLGDALTEVFGDKFEDAVFGIRGALIDHKDDLNTYAMAESSKVLNDMALISRTEDAESEFSVREGYEYVVGEGYLEVLMKEAFVKYFGWCNRKGFKPLYTTAEGFINSVGKSPAATDLRCFDSKLRSGQLSRVFRFSLEKLTAEGIEMFKSKSLD